MSCFMDLKVSSLVSAALGPQRVVRLGVIFQDRQPHQVDLGVLDHILWEEWYIVLYRQRAHPAATRLERTYLRSLFQLLLPVGGLSH